MSDMFIFKTDQNSGGELLNLAGLETYLSALAQEDRKFSRGLAKLAVSASLIYFLPHYVIDNARLLFQFLPVASVRHLLYVAAFVPLIWWIIISLEIFTLFCKTVYSSRVNRNSSPALA